MFTVKIMDSDHTEVYSVPHYSICDTPEYHGAFVILHDTVYSHENGLEISLVDDSEDPNHRVCIVESVAGNTVNRIVPRQVEVHTPV